MMRSYRVILAALFLFLPLAWGLQAIDAENALLERNFLESGEKAVVFKALPQTNGVQKYWVVSLLQGDVLRTVIPIADKDSAVVPAGTLHTNLVSANYLVQRISFLKQQTSWLVSLPTVNKLEELANAVENEEFDVDIVSETVSNPSLQVEISSLKGKLASMVDDIRSVANGIKSLSEDETSFLNVSINTSVVNTISTKYGAVFDAIDSLKEDAASYDQSISKVKNQIASDNALDAQTKSQLLGLLSPLGPNQTLTSSFSYYADLAAENKQRITTEFASIQTKVSALEAEGNNRVARSLAYVVLYGDDSSLLNITGFSSLSHAAQVILAEENRYRWENQSGVNDFEGAWNNAVSAFGKKQYTSAKETGEKAKVLVKQIKSAGIADGTDSSQSASDTLITGIAFVLGGIALILIGRKALELFTSSRQGNE
ncbi:MAG: hypothetical protein V1776_05285 [Candidatus Diapherotrites archaeon]